MKKLLLTSMLCFCMLMQGCTISELDTAKNILEGFSEQLHLLFTLYYLLKC